MFLRLASIVLLFDYILNQSCEALSINKFRQHGIFLRQSSPLSPPYLMLFWLRKETGQILRPCKTTEGRGEKSISEILSVFLLSELWKNAPILAFVSTCFVQDCRFQFSQTFKSVTITLWKQKESFLFFIFQWFSTNESDGSYYIYYYYYYIED